ncbi:P-loop containing nucleoside triphosphate hydrolase protein [Lipomyces japonicus]|uniref:P-loop containing nucleoside triphosphate hydrolase protein n=1 Tax=Lipomyces japonicus TaxID=56871 RepID=UPI0034CE1467
MIFARQHIWLHALKLSASFQCRQFCKTAGLELAIASNSKGPAPTIPRISRGLPKKVKLRGVDKVIAVSSAKGGVGKSTVSVNLALSLAMTGKRVGILDTDIFGPSIPRLLNLSGEPNVTPDNRLIPLSNYGVKAMSMGFLIPDSDAPIVWRGLMVMKALQQLLHEVEWGGLDVLVLDLPPGTGDTQLTITQQIVLDGAVIVSTPQDIALIDAVKGLNMFKKVDVPVLGMVQNMSVFVCPNCNHETHIFGTDGVDREAKRLGTEVLGSIPLHASICQLSDAGKPVVIADPDSFNSKAYKNVAENVLKKIYP